MRIRGFQSDGDFVSYCLVRHRTPVRGRINMLFNCCRVFLDRRIFRRWSGVRLDTSISGKPFYLFQTLVFRLLNLLFRSSVEAASVAQLMELQDQCKNLTEEEWCRSLPNMQRTQKRECRIRSDVSEPPIVSLERVLDWDFKNPKLVFVQLSGGSIHQFFYILPDVSRAFYHAVLARLILCIACIRETFRLSPPW